VDAEELKLAYRRLALLYHPDRHAAEDRPAAEEVFKRISAAYRTLSDERERKRYDQSLRRGDEFRESADSGEGNTLGEILAEINAYEHIFSEGELAALDDTLRDAVVVNLIDDLQEQVVGVYRMWQAPVGETHEGKFKVGAMVLTSVRVLLPYSYTWTVRDGNTETTYTGWSMPSIALPNITRVRIVSRTRVEPELQVTFEYRDVSTTFSPGQRNLGKLLLLAHFWGIPVQVDVENDRGRELRRALAKPFLVAGAWILGIFAVAAVLGLIFMDGFLETPAQFAVYLWSIGVWQCLMLVCSILAARRLQAWVHAYESLDPVALLENTTTDQPTSQAMAASGR
jgi:DnaJ-domain-containing protein 1